MFWPRVVWSKYAGSLAAFMDPQHADAALRCLNHLVTNALAHAADSLEYLSRLQDPQVFRFCAIPQVMAIATLAACYNNPAVFTSVVKITRPMRCMLFSVLNMFLPHFCAQRAHHGHDAHKE